MNTIFEEFSALVAIPFIVLIIAGFAGVLKTVVELSMEYTIG